MITTLFDLTFHEVVEVAVVSAMVFDGIPGLRDGHGLQTKLELYVLNKWQGCTESDTAATGIKTDTMKGETEIQTKRNHFLYLLSMVEDIDI